jgi:hypothetical protein
MRMGPPIKHNQNVEAYAAYKRGDIPKDAYDAFKAQVHSAYRRRIPFLFTIHTWWAWWRKGNRFSRRGLGKGKLVMARKGDRGPYGPRNVYCCTHENNIRRIDTSQLGEKLKASWAKRSAQQSFKWHLAIRGDGHPCSKAVLGPLGRFGSIRVAADAAGVNERTIRYRIKNAIDGWRHETDADRTGSLPDLLAAD